MDSHPCSLADVLAALARGAAVVTGNQRAARTLHSLYREQQLAAGRLVAQSPELLPWESWTASLWQKLLLAGAEQRLLLNSAQERLLWREIIAEDDDLATLSSTDSLAEIAAGAWALLSRYGGRSQLQPLAAATDTRAFAAWAGSFERRCRTEKLLPPVEIEDALCSAAAQGALHIHTEVLLLGFDGLTPAQERLAAALQASGVALQWAELQHEAADRGAHLLMTAVTEQDELQAAAQWTRRALVQSPAARIALIVPNLDEDRAEIERVFRDALAPELHDIAASSPVPYELSLGAPLSTLSMVSAAVELLHWTLAPLPIERITALLLSPYLGRGDAAERSARAELDAFVLRRMNLLQPELSLRDALQAAGKNPRFASTARLLAAVLQAAGDRGLSSGRTRGHAEWMEDVRELLRAAGWPGARPLDSAEFQLHRRWERALDLVATLDFSGKRVSFADALSALQRTLRETRFAPQSHNAPVQIMGVLESAGSLFDAVWFLRGDDAAWPPRPGPHPLLPWQLQRKFGMPGADSARIRQEARSVVQRIRRSAPQVIFSYAQEGADGPQRRSSVLSELGWPEEFAVAITPPSPIAQTELVPDEEPLPALPSRVLRGGESVLRLQAACGFRAFAERRLWATGLDAVTLGMDAQQRGVLLHEVIRRFWGTVKTQDALRAMGEAERTSLLTQCIDAALGSPASGSAWETAYLQTQQRRLLALLSTWMDVELDRKPFEVLLSEAAFDDVAVGPLRLGLRIDRVDRVEGGEVLLDYKTGRASVPGWSGPRPEEPQLPLYAAFARTQPLQAIAFAKLRAGKEMKLEGYDAGNAALPLRQVDLDQQLEEWRAVLLQLAEDFAAGRADVDPKKYPQTCEYCAQRLICRVDSTPPSSSDPDEACEDAEESLG